MIHAGIAENTETVEGLVGPEPVEESAKMHQIFEGARQVFLRDGFDGASMNDIARAAGVSKGTVYAYFVGKEQLFEALVIFDRQRQAEQICQFDRDDPDTRAVLQRFGTELMMTMLQPEHLAHLRMVIGIAARFPKIGQAFYDAGPRCAVNKLSNYLREKSDAGVLRIADSTLAARQLIELCKADLFLSAVFAQTAQFGSDEIEKKISGALDMFLSYYGKHETNGADT
ncbi:MAG: TetR/AcrR family transcriptional regulator [Hyphomicrobiales bacterium]|nr:TetR/AcrR family transcriptional regulator [Hyphomicrobiales bacterium]MDE2116149.1 TetR/AcrR family transcriptional regulator [Hyphomicrobiales bacterium]